MNTSLLLQAAYIDGAWLQAQDTVAVDNPATGDIIGHVPNMGTAATVAKPHRTTARRCVAALV